MLEDPAALGVKDCVVGDDEVARRLVEVDPERPIGERPHIRADVVRDDGPGRDRLDAEVVDAGGPCQMSAPVRCCGCG